MSKKLEPYKPIEIEIDNNIRQFQEFDGFADLFVDISLPYMYFQAIQELSKKIGIPLREWINLAVVNTIDDLVKQKDQLGSVINDEFLFKYRIGLLSAGMKKNLIQKDRIFGMEEFVIRK